MTFIMYKDDNNYIILSPYFTFQHSLQTSEQKSSTVLLLQQRLASLVGSAEICTIMSVGSHPIKRCWPYIESVLLYSV